MKLRVVLATQYPLPSFTWTTTELVAGAEGEQLMEAVSKLEQPEGRPCQV